MKREEKVKIAYEAILAERASKYRGELVVKEYMDSLTDDPAPTLPGDPRAVELADYVDRHPFRKRAKEISAILRRAPAPGITLDDVERWMRWGRATDGEIAAMRKELGGR